LIISVILYPHRVGNIFGSEETFNEFMKEFPHRLCGYKMIKDFLGNIPIDIGTAIVEQNK
jgi:hypothetical protein